MRDKEFEDSMNAIYTPRERAFWAGFLKGLLAYKDSEEYYVSRNRSPEQKLEAYIDLVTSFHKKMPEYIQNTRPFKPSILRYDAKRFVLWVFPDLDDEPGEVWFNQPFEIGDRKFRAKARVPGDLVLTEHEMEWIRQEIVRVTHDDLMKFLDNETRKSWKVNYPLDPDGNSDPNAETLRDKIARFTKEDKRPNSFLDHVLTVEKFGDYFPGLWTAHRFISHEDAFEIVEKLFPELKNENTEEDYRTEEEVLSEFTARMKEIFGKK